MVPNNTCGAKRNITKVPLIKELEHTSFPKRPWIENFRPYRETNNYLRKYDITKYILKKGNNIKHTYEDSEKGFINFSSYDFTWIREFIDHVFSSHLVVPFPDSLIVPAISWLTITKRKGYQISSLSTQSSWPIFSSF